jgi:hypothetical protein
MKAYNHALDYLALAGEQFGKGRLKVAAKCLARAVKAPDFQQALAIIEANNHAAFTAQASTAKPAKKPVAAKSKVLSAEDAALESLVGDLDELDEDADMEEDESEDEEGENEGDEEVDAEFEPEGEADEVENEAVEDEEEEGAAFAAVLASMTKPKKATASKTAKKPVRK